MDIQPAIEYFLIAKEAEGLTDRTLEDYGAKLFRFARQAEIETVSDITLPVVREFITSLIRRKKAGELSSATVASSVRPVKVFVRFLCNNEPPLLLVDPFKKIEIPSVDRMLHDTIDDADARRLIDACDLSTHEGRRNAAIVCFLLDTGVRVGELVNIKHSDIEIKTREARVFGKGSKQRQVFFSATTAMALTRYIYRTPERYRHPEWLWTSLRRNVGGRITENGVHQMLSRLKAASGVTCRVNPHTFRHTFATNYLRAGGDLNSLMRLMGHADLTILQTYLSLANEDLRKKHDQFSPMARVMAGGRR